MSPVASRRCCSAIASSRTSSPYWAWRSCPARPSSPFYRARKIERFFSQPFFVAEQYTGIQGRYVPLEETIKGFKEIIEGKLDDVPEQAFFMAGTIDEVRERAHKA